MSATNTQPADFAAAVALIGGPSAAAPLFGVTVRQVQRVLAGASPIRLAYLAALAAELRAHAERARALERRLSPDFETNLTPAQRAAALQRAL